MREATSSGSPALTEVGGLVKRLLDPPHDVVRIGWVKACGGEGLLEILGEAGRHDGAWADGVDEDAVRSQGLGQILGHARDGSLGCRVGHQNGALTLNGVSREDRNAGPVGGP